MSKIRIVNWLLTRRCNLKCDYCAIVKNYEGMPEEYPPMSYYKENEMTTSDVIEGLFQFQKHNSDCFHILYGGEPLLRKDLATIISFCNRENIHYTIISNNTSEIQPLIQKLKDNVEGKIKGFTASVDPVFFDKDQSEDRVRKSLQGFESLKEMKKDVEDVVAEITVMKHNQQHLYRLVKLLTESEINSDITFVDIAKSPYYDFSNIYERELLVYPSAMLADQFQKINDSDADVHMKKVLLPEMWDTLPSNMDCEIDKNLHNVSVDADGSIRLCLRIRGVSTPKLVKIKDLFDSKHNVSPIAHAAIKSDKKEYCKLCNHTCHIMSKYIDQNNISPDDLVHLDRRK